jgi:hypothetical protein
MQRNDGRLLTERSDGLHDFCYTPRAKGGLPWGVLLKIRGKGTQCFGSHNMILPILTVNLRQVASRWRDYGERQIQT